MDSLITINGKNSYMMRPDRLVIFSTSKNTEMYNWRGWCNSNALDSIQEMLCSILGWANGYSEVFTVFLSQSPKENARIGS